MQQFYRLNFQLQGVAVSIKESFNVYRHIGVWFCFEEIDWKNERVGKVSFFPFCSPSATGHIRAAKMGGVAIPLPLLTRLPPSHFTNQNRQRKAEKVE